MKVDSVLVAVILEILWKYKYKHIWFVSLLCCHWNTVYLNNLSTSPKSLLGAHPTFYQPLHIWTILPQHTKQPRQVRPWRPGAVTTNQNGGVQTIADCVNTAHRSPSILRPEWVMGPIDIFGMEIRSSKVRYCRFWKEKNFGELIVIVMSYWS